MSIKYDILTLFPGMVDDVTSSTMLGRAKKNKHIEVNSFNIRDWAKDKQRTVDDVPYGGGAGMVLKPEPLFDAIESLKTSKSKIIYMAPDGVPLTTNLAEKLSHNNHLIILSGHYEGVDQRVRDEVVDLEISIGDYIITNGTLAALVLIDAISRHIPNFLGSEKSLTEESFMNNLLAFPQYTRPSIYRKLSVPEVLLSGNHKAIEDWRYEQQLKKTSKLRPDLLKIKKNKND